jgi:hypothetical protein
LQVRDTRTRDNSRARKEGGNDNGLKVTTDIATGTPASFEVPGWELVRELVKERRLEFPAVMHLLLLLLNPTFQI